jgi:hypothetical protein
MIEWLPYRRAEFFGVRPHEVALVEPRRVAADEGAAIPVQSKKNKE